MRTETERTTPLSSPSSPHPCPASHAHARRSMIALCLCPASQVCRGGSTARSGRVLGRGGSATCYDAAPSGAHASSIGKHARILTAYDGCDMADEAALAVENFPTVAAAALGFGFFELGLMTYRRAQRTCCGTRIPSRRR
eukprot:scaffold1348_cov130-Isochrysis_galbana.AAC.4